MGLVSYVQSRGAVGVKITGLEDILARLDNVRVDLQKRLLVDVMKKSLEKALLEAQARAPTGPAIERTHKKSGGRFTNIPGVLKRSFRIKKMRSDNPYVLEVQLQNTAFYALWVEAGHKIVKGKKGARRVVGHSPAKPFMQPVYESQKTSIIMEVEIGIDQALKRRGF